jgi:hypothetical protein
MARPEFDEVWGRIGDLAGEVFHTKRGLEFTYRIAGNTLTTTRTDFPLSRTDFERAYRLMPLPGPGEISEIVRGPAYIWAILHDVRVTGGAR